MNSQAPVLSETEGTLLIDHGFSEEPVKIFRFPNLPQEIAIPLRYLAELRQPALELIPELQEAIAEMPNPWLLRKVLLLSNSFMSKQGTHARLWKSPHGILLQLGCPYSGLSLSRDLLEIYAQIIDRKDLLERYLFELAVKLQAELGEQTPLFPSSSDLFRYLVAYQCSEQLSDTDIHERPLLSLIALEAIENASKLLESLDSESIDSKSAGPEFVDPESVSPKSVDSESVDPESELKTLILRRLSWIQKKKHEIQTKSLPKIIDELCRLVDSDKSTFQLEVEAHEQNTSKPDGGELHKQSALKLLLHFAGSASLSGLKPDQLDLASEPVDSQMLRNLQFLPSLHSLNLSNTIFPQAVSVSELAEKLSNLRSLDLSSTRIQNHHVLQLSKLKSLEEIDCSFTNLSDEGARHFLSFPRLQRLKLSPNIISEAMHKLLESGKIIVQID